MIPIFTLVTTLITIGVTALLIGVLMRINDPRRRRGDGGETSIGADGGGSGRGARQGQDVDNGNSDGGGGGDGGGD